VPQWRNQLVAFHGTDDSWLNPTPGTKRNHTVGAAVSFVPNLALCSPFTDFGQGFYLTTRLHQAKQWANAKVLRAGSKTHLTAIVLRFQMDREWLATLDSLAFVRETKEFWNLVTDCRHGFPPHQRLPPSPLPYDVVYGPVSLWRQILVIQNCDQISFHSRRAIFGIPQPTIAAFGARPDANDFIF
jgi:hypothetical protein